MLIKFGAKNMWKNVCIWLQDRTRRTKNNIYVFCCATGRHGKNSIFFYTRSWKSFLQWNKKKKAHRAADPTESCKNVSPGSSRKFLLQSHPFVPLPTSSPPHTHTLTYTWLPTSPALVRHGGAYRMRINTEHLWFFPKDKIVIWEFPLEFWGNDPRLEERSVIAHPLRWHCVVI